MMRREDRFATAAYLVTGWAMLVLCVLMFAGAAALAFGVIGL